MDSKVLNLFGIFLALLLLKTSASTPVVDPATNESYTLLLASEKSLYKVEMKNNDVGEVEMIEDFSSHHMKIDLLTSDQKSGEVYMFDNQEKVLWKLKDLAEGPKQLKKFNKKENFTTVEVSSKTKNIYLASGHFIKKFSENGSVTTNDLKYQIVDVSVAEESEELFILLDNNFIKKCNLEVRDCAYYHLNLPEEKKKMTMTIDEKEKKVFVAWNKTIVGYNYDQMIQYDLHQTETEIEGIVFKPDNREVYWTHQGGIIGWDNVTLQINVTTKEEKLHLVVLKSDVFERGPQEGEGKIWIWVLLGILGIIILVFIILSIKIIHRKIEERKLARSSEIPEPPATEVSAGEVSYHCQKL